MEICVQSAHHNGIYEWFGGAFEVTKGVSMQASFDPPGLTVAVKRDRAVENLLNGGSQFVVNILAEGDHKALMKQLLKSFKPGEDRFAGLAIQVRHRHDEKGSAGFLSFYWRHKQTSFTSSHTLLKVYGA